MSLRLIPIALMVPLLFAGCGKSSAPATAPVRLDAPTLRLEASSAAGLAEVGGTVESAQRLQLASRLSGFVTRVAVREGEQVKRGQLLLQIDPADVLARLGQARAGLAAAQAAAANADADSQRDTALLRDEVIPRQQWERQQLRQAQAAAQLAAARADLAQARAQVAYAELRAPMAGLVVEKSVNPGDLATPGRTLLVLDGRGPLQVRSEVDDAVYAQLKLGATAQVWSERQRCDARIAQLVPAQDPISHTHLVKLDLGRGCALRSGSYVRVGLLAHDPHPQLLLPRQALLTRAGMQGVFVVGADGSAAFRLLRLGAEVGDRVEVQAGLQPGETVVIGKLDQVANGTLIAGAAR